MVMISSSLSTFEEIFEAQKTPRGLHDRQFVLGSTTRRIPYVRSIVHAIFQNLAYITISPNAMFEVHVLHSIHRIHIATMSCSHCASLTVGRGLAYNAVMILLMCLVPPPRTLLKKYAHNLPLPTH